MLASWYERSFRKLNYELHHTVLDNGSQVWWRSVERNTNDLASLSLTHALTACRWVNIFVTLGVWALELNVDRDDFDDDGESIVSWNRD